MKEKIKIKRIPEEILKSRGVIAADGCIARVTTDQIIEAMKEYGRWTVEAQRDLMSRHLNMRNVPTPFDNEF